MSNPGGFGLDNAFGLLMRHGLQFDTPTHPGTRRRLAQFGRVLLNPEQTETVASRQGGEPR